MTEAPGAKYDRKRILKLFKAAFINSLHQRQGVVYQVIHIPGLLRHIAGKSLQDILIPDIAHKPVAGLNVNDMYHSALGAEGFRNCLADPVRAACDDGHFVFKSHMLPHDFISIEFMIIFLNGLTCISAGSV